MTTLTDPTTSSSQMGRRWFLTGALVAVGCGLLRAVLGLKDDGSAIHLVQVAALSGLGALVLGAMAYTAGYAFAEHGRARKRSGRKGSRQFLSKHSHSTLGTEVPWLPTAPAPVQPAQRPADARTTVAPKAKFATRLPMEAVLKCARRAIPLALSALVFGVALLVLLKKDPSIPAKAPLQAAALAPTSPDAAPGAAANLAPHAVTPSKADEARPTPAAAVAEGTVPTLAKDAPTAKTARDSSAADDLLRSVVTANEASIKNVIKLAGSGQSVDLVGTARAAGRAFNFAEAGGTTTRNRGKARKANQDALNQFAVDAPKEKYAELVDLQRTALREDSLSMEVAGNLAIYLLRAGDASAAYRYAVYALSLPRGSNRVGRTADWTTLAAAFAAAGDPQQARDALLVTALSSSDLRRSCEGLVKDVQRVYGPVLRSATEAALAEIRRRGLASAPECAAPTW